jgi:ATP-dependent Clp protease ATP-binding subunit ClpA
VFERFTDDARSAVVAAREEARAFGGDHVGTEHLLLGILREPDSIGGQVLTGAGMALEGTRAEIERIAARSAAPTADELPFTPEAKKAFENALREALSLHADKIGTEHLVLGVAADEHGIGAQILQSHNVTASHVRQAVMAHLTVRGVPARAWRGGSRVAQQLARGQNMTPAVATFYLRARERAGRGPVSSADILRALLDDKDSQAVRALAALGITAEDLERAIATTPVEGTTDETAEDAVARMVDVTVRDDRVVIEIADPALSTRLGGDVPDVPPRVARALDTLRQRLWEVARAAERGGGASMGE